MDSYEKKYKEALENARQEYNTTENVERKQWLEELFPELAESEDERIRKAIHIYLDWLDGRNKDCQPKGEYTIRDMIAWLEKQGEQKPIDKIESTFHESDWIVQENIGVYKIIEVCESWYEVIDIEDNHYSISFDKEYMYHLWSIKDAKEGDVIYLPNGNNEYYLFIFKGIENAAVMSFAHFYQYNDGTSVVEGTIDNLYSVNDVFQPATKQQRDQLEKAMADARYTFDFEKKKLRKIEQKPTDEEMKELLRTEYEKGRADAIAEMQNLAWNEDDEEFLRRAINATKDAYPMTAKWLKSLRTQNKWKPSEEQKSVAS